MRITKIKYSKLIAVGVFFIATAVWSVLSSSSAYAATFTVTNTNSDGAGSLYQAIVDANAAPDADTIVFNIPGSGPHTINYLREDIDPDPDVIGGLPAITSPLTIDACTQPGSDCNAESLQPMIELRGDYAGGVGAAGLPASLAGIKITSTSSVTLRGLIVNRTYTYACAPPPVNTCTTGVTSPVTVTDSSDLLFEANIIGTDANGTPGLGSTTSTQAAIVVQDQSSDITIRGNTLAGYSRGVYLQGGDPPDVVSDVTIESNVIGTNNDGAADLGNMNATAGGIFVSYSVDGVTIRNNTIAGYGNGIHARSFRGLPAPQRYLNNVTITGNKLGVAPNGSVLPNNVGIAAGQCAGNVRIGGLAAGEGNIVEYTINTGVHVSDSSTCTPGTQGYAIVGNTIRNNDGAGVVVTGTSDPTGITIRRNAIYANGDIGIDLSPTDFYGDGVTANGPANTLRAGPNNLVNHPVITKVEHGSLVVEGTYAGLANEQYTLDFYISDSSGGNNGQTWVGEDIVTTDANGNATFSFTFDVDVPEGWEVTATATDSNGSTSEFSEFLTMPPVPPSAPGGDPSGNDSDDALAETGSSLSVYILFALALLGAGVLTTKLHKKNS